MSTDAPRLLRIGASRGTVVIMFRTLVDLVLPRRCVGCGRPGRVLCLSCAPRRPPLLIGLPTLRVAAAGSYEGGLRRAVLAFKERGRRELTASLAALMVAAAAATSRPGLVLVPVPSTRSAARRRGGDHVRRLARHAGVSLGMPVVAALELVRPVRDSAGLGSQARRANMGHAMRARAPAPGAIALIVDDIVTTGATLVEAARALRAAGWHVAGASVIATTPRRADAIRRPDT